MAAPGTGWPSALRTVRNRLKVWDQEQPVRRTTAATTSPVVLYGCLMIASGKLGRNGPILPIPFPTIHAANSAPAGAPMEMRNAPGRAGAFLIATTVRVQLSR